MHHNSEIITTEYLDRFQYVDEDLQFFPIPIAIGKGYVRKTDGTNRKWFDYVYNYTDHLGNIRLSYTTDPISGSTNNIKILEENNYYPFGLQHGSYNTPARDYRPIGDAREIETVDHNPYKYKYNAKEYQDELGLNVTAMDFRQYDNALGRFLNPDALSEISMSWTPYRFAFDNPVLWSDPTGLYELNADGSIRATSQEEYEVIMNYFNNYEGNGDLYEGALAALDEAGFGLEMINLGDVVAVGKSSKSESSEVLANNEQEPSFDAYDGGQYGSQLASMNKSNQARIKHNAKGWTDAKGNWRNATEIQKKANGKYVRGVQGIRNSKNIAEVTSRNLSKVAKKWGAVGTAITLVEGVSDGNFTVGDGTQTAITLISTFGGPVGWGYALIDLGVSLSTGKGFTERIGEAIDQGTGGAGIEF